MSKILKRSELAKALDISNASITMAIKNKVLISNEDRTIDIDKPINQLWIEKQIAKGRTFDMNRLFKSEKTKQNPQKRSETSKKRNKNEGKRNKVEETQTENDKSIEELREIELKIKQENLKKLVKSNKLSELEIAKKEGALIPFDAAKTFFLFTVETFVKTFSQESKSLANIMVNRFGGDKKHLIEVQKELQAQLETIKANTVKQIEKGIENIIDEYSEVRSRGERK